MSKMFFMIGGGIWGSESKEAMSSYGKELNEEEDNSRRALFEDKPLHCFVGNKGYSGGGSWPKEGWYCKCSAIILKSKP